jgi:hypothetical protein
MAICPYHGFKYVGHGGGPPPSLVVVPVGRRGGVAGGVGNTISTVVAILATNTTTVAVVVSVLVVVAAAVVVGAIAVGLARRAWHQGRQQRSGWRVVRVERHRSSSWTGGVQVNFLQ